MLRPRAAKVQNVAMDWDDVRHFLAVARTGSTLAGGKALRVSQTTAARRVAALERTLGLALFERSQAGYRLTAAGEALLDGAGRMEAAAETLAAAAAAQARAVSGTVRLTTEELYVITILAPILRDLHAAFPAIRIELDTTERVRDLAADEADIALRSSVSPTGGGLVGRRIADDAWTVYCSTGYAAAHGIPRTHAALREHTMIGGGGAGSAASTARGCTGTGLRTGSRSTTARPPACSRRCAPGSAWRCCPASSPIASSTCGAACRRCSRPIAACGC